MKHIHRTDTNPDNTPFDTLWYLLTFWYLWPTESLLLSEDHRTIQWTFLPHLVLVGRKVSEKIWKTDSIVDAHTHIAASCCFLYCRSTTKKQKQKHKQNNTNKQQNHKLSRGSSNKQFYQVSLHLVQWIQKTKKIENKRHPFCHIWATFCCGLPINVWVSWGKNGHFFLWVHKIYHLGQSFHNFCSLSSKGGSFLCWTDKLQDLDSSNHH